MPGTVTGYAALESGFDLGAFLSAVTFQLRDLQYQPPGVTEVVVPGTPTTVGPGAPNPPLSGPPIIDPITGQPLPSLPPVVIQQGILPVEDIIITPGAEFNSIYADVEWTVPPNSNAVSFMVEYGPMNADGTVALIGTPQVNGDSIRLTNLDPRTTYGLQILAMNIIGQVAASPSGSYQQFTTTSDPTVPPQIDTSSIEVGSGATSVIVAFQPLSIEQAPDVANGNGSYIVDISTDQNFDTVQGTEISASTVVAFNNVYPTATLETNIGVNDVNVPVQFANTSKWPVNQPFTALIDDEWISFSAMSGDEATILARNVGQSPLVNGNEAHYAGATATVQTKVTWYARIAAIDSSGNQGPWAYSNGNMVTGVVDSMLVGGISAAQIQFGLMQGNMIEANSLSVNTLTSGTLATANIELLGGSFVAGDPPNTGLIMNSQGITLYSNGSPSIGLNAVTGIADFYDSLNGASIFGGLIVGSMIETSQTAPRSIMQNTPPGYNVLSNTPTGGFQIDMGSPNDGGQFATFTGYTDNNGYTGVAIQTGGVWAQGGRGANYLWMDSTGMTIDFQGSGAGAKFSFNGSFVVSATDIELPGIWTSGNFLYLNNNNGFVDSGGNITTPNLYIGTGTTFGHISWVSGGTGYLFQDQSGNYQALHASAFTVASDKALKTRIRTMKADGMLMDLRPVSYKDHHKHERFGFVAQEVREIAPRLVYEDPEGLLSLDYLGLIAPMVAEIQKLRKEVDALTANAGR